MNANKFGQLIGETKTEQGIIDFVQNRVNMVAEILINEMPEIAKNHPKEIGEMAKKMVFEFLKENRSVTIHSILTQ